MKQQDAQTTRFIIGTGVVVLAGYYGYNLFLKPILDKLDFYKKEEEKKAEEALNKTKRDEINTAITQQTQAGHPPTKTEAEWRSIANVIYEDLKGRFDYMDNKSDAIYQVCRVKNDADFWTLYKAFGKRQETVFGYGLKTQPLDLKQFLNANLSRQQLNIINGNYQRKNANPVNGPLTITL